MSAPIERVISAILFGIIVGLLVPVAAIFRIYDWLQDRRFERETNAKYGERSA